MFLTIVVFIITLLILILSHEFGHFLAAKKFGVKVLEFGFGIPPRIWGKKIGQTLVSFNLLPIGGFVRLFGEDEVDKKVLESKDSFASQPVLQRMVIVAAGVAVNLLLAVIVFWAVLFAQGFKTTVPLLIPHQFAGVNQKNETVIFVQEVSPDSPAAQAGFKAGDQIAEFNGVKLENSNQLLDLSKKHGGEKVELTLTNEQNQTRKVEIVPRAVPPAGQGPLGISLAVLPIARLNYETPGQKIASGPVHSYNLTVYSVKVLGSLISASLEKKDIEPVSQSVSGPIGLTQLVKSILQMESPLIPLLNFIALLSLNLAIINILPFPALDGGRLFFLLIEAVIRRRVTPSVERMVHTVGMVILITLIMVITFSDISKFF